MFFINQSGSLHQFVLWSFKSKEKQSQVTFSFSSQCYLRASLSLNQLLGSDCFKKLSTFFPLTSCFVSSVSLLVYSPLESAYLMTALLWLSLRVSDCGCLQGRVHACVCTFLWHYVTKSFDSGKVVFGALVGVWGYDSNRTEPSDMVLPKRS